MEAVVHWIGVFWWHGWMSEALDARMGLFGI
jgi:hypothetical protein